MTDDPILTEVGKQEWDAELSRLMRCNQLTLHPRRDQMPEEFFLLDDGRPAVHKGDLMGQPHAMTMTLQAWDVSKSKFAAMSQPKGSRERACPDCGCAITPTHEYGDTWAFRCPGCQLVDVWGKQYAGGTWGAGEKERT